MPAAPLSDATLPDLSAAWPADTLGVNTRTGEWFVALEYENTTIAGQQMDILWARNLTLAHGRHAVAKNTREFSHLRVLGAQDVHQAFENAFAALNTRKRFRKLSSVEYRTLLAELRADITHPEPVTLAQAWRRALYYLNATRQGQGENRGGSIDLQQITDECFTMFAQLMRRTYGDMAEPSLAAMRATFAPQAETPKKGRGGKKKPDEGDVAEGSPATVTDDDAQEAPSTHYPFALTIHDVVLDGAEAPAPAPILHLIPTDIPPASEPPTPEDVAGAQAALPHHPLLADADRTMNRAAYLALVNMLKNPIARKSTLDLSEALGITLDETRGYLQNAKALIEAAQPKEAPRVFVPRQDTPPPARPAMKAKPVRAVQPPRAKTPRVQTPKLTAQKTPRPAPAPKPALAPLESIDFGAFTIDRYDRSKRACVVRGTDYHLTVPTLRVLSMLAGQADRLVPLSGVRTAAGDGASAHILAYKALDTIEDLYAQDFAGPQAGQKLTRYRGYVWFMNDKPAPAALPKPEKPARAPRVKAEKPAKPEILPLERFEIGALVLERYDRTRHPWAVQGQDYKLAASTVTVLKILAEAAQAGTYYVSTAALRSALGTASSEVVLSKALAEITALFAQDFIQPPVAGALVRPAKTGVVALSPEAVFNRTPAQPPKPTLQDAFHAAALPAHFDTGDFTIDYVADRVLPARINAGDAGLGHKQYGIVIDLFNQRGTATPSAAIGAKYYPTHIRPKATALASIARIRAAFAKAGLANADTLIQTVPGGHVYTGAPVTAASIPTLPEPPAVPSRPVRAPKMRAPKTPQPPKAKAVKAPEIMPDLHYHPAYGPGLALGPVTRDVAGMSITLERFLPLTLKENGDEILMSEKQVRAGFGRLDIDAYRRAMALGAHELRACINRKTYDGPPPSAVEKVIQSLHSPADRIPLLASFAFYIPLRGAATATSTMHTQLERSIVRAMVLAYPFLSSKQAHKHLQILQTTLRPIPDHMVWPFESGQDFARVSAALDAWLATIRKGNKGQLGEFQLAAMGTARKGNGAETYDVKGYLEARAGRKYPGLVAG